MLNFSNVHHRSEIAYVMINCETGYETSVLEEIRELAGIKEIRGTIGSYDIIVKIESESTEQLRDLIAMKIRRTPKILTTTTLLCIEQSTPLLSHSTH
ncbi:MAG: Lrp/AsnC family transcriptional regulator [Nitrosopumilales archaeon]|nr:MAG: Lrp/AsnC family transcriptional regulator [Nitrosopumilales archaeon]